MKVGVIGIGRFGQNHVRNLSEMGVLAGLADRDEAALAASSESFGVPGFADHRELIAAVDAVVIATPPASHGALAADALNAGRAVLVEKPMTLDLAEAESISALAEEKGAVLMVGHLLIYQSAISFIAQALADGMIGSLLSLHQERLNLGRARREENALWSLGVHDIAVACHLIPGEPEDVVLSSSSHLTEGVADDTYLHIRFAGGATAHIHSSWLWPRLSRRLTLVGTEGMLVFDETTSQVVLHRKRIGEDLANQDGGEEVVFEGTSQPLRIELEHFVECARTGAKPRTDGASALRVMRILDRAQGSA